MTAAGELVTRCFAARTATHIAHLRTRSYAAHMALNEFYDEIVDLADKFAEVYQGHFGMIPDWPETPVPPVGTDSTRVIQDLSNWCTENRDDCARQRTDLENIIDEITAQCGHTIYKLTAFRQP